MGYTKKEIEELRNLWNKVNIRIENENTFEGILGDGNGRLYYEQDKITVYVRVLKPSGMSITKARCLSLAPVYGLPVRLKENPIDKILEVVSTEPQKAAEFSQQYSTGNVGAHASQHQRYGPDPLRLNSLQYEPLLTIPFSSNSLDVYLCPITYKNSSEEFTYFSGDTTDLTSYIPGSSGDQRVVVVGLNITTGNIEIVSSNTQFKGSYTKQVPFAFNESLSLVTIPTDVIPSAMIRLAYGQTSIELWDIFMDLRPWFLLGGQGVSVGSFAILFFQDNLTTNSNAVYPFSLQELNGLTWNSSNNYVSCPAGLYEITADVLLEWNSGQLTAGTAYNIGVLIDGSLALDIFSVFCNRVARPPNDNNSATTPFIVKWFIRTTTTSQLKISGDRFDSSKANVLNVIVKVERIS